MELNGTVASLNVGRRRGGPGLPARGTAIDKRPVEGRLAIGRLGLDGDVQVNRTVHGGVHQAVYAYALEDLRWWAGELAGSLGGGPHPGQFGENVTTIGVDVTNAVIGERWQVGSAVLEVSAPRIPCRTFATWIDVPRWVKRFADRGASGAYLRVIEEGTCERGDDVVVLSRPDSDITVTRVFAAALGERADVARIADTAGLPPALAARLRTLADAEPARVMSLF
jgi:MOSC domain-containing protein YiiM